MCNCGRERARVALGGEEACLYRLAWRERGAHPKEAPAAVEAKSAGVGRMNRVRCLASSPTSTAKGARCPMPQHSLATPNTALHSPAEKAGFAQPSKVKTLARSCDTCHAICSLDSIARAESAVAVFCVGHGGLAVIAPCCARYAPRDKASAKELALNCSPV